MPFFVTYQNIITKYYILENLKNGRGISSSISNSSIVNPIESKPLNTNPM